MKFGTETLTNCQICGKELPTKAIVINDIEGKFLYTCPQCYGLLLTCSSCEYIQNCGFINDHSEPQIVQQTVRQGPVVMSTQVKNPNLIQKHCAICRCGTINGQNIDCERERDNGLHCSNHKILSNLLQ